MFLPRLPGFGLDFERQMLYFGGFFRSTYGAFFHVTFSSGLECFVGFFFDLECFVGFADSLLWLRHDMNK